MIYGQHGRLSSLSIICMRRSASSTRNFKAIRFTATLKEVRESEEGILLYMDSLQTRVLLVDQNRDNNRK